MKKKIDSVTEKILNDILLEKEEISRIERHLREILKKIKSRLSSNNVNPEIFLGGSYAKKTLIKKEKYDVDIFLRFPKEYREHNISSVTEKILKQEFSALEKIHGSRDYFRIKIENIFFEIIPVIKVSKPENAENITDLSYFHVKYLKNKIKSKEVLNQIMLTKAFCQANGFYGAESYISGFSGYSIEILILYYKTFENFLKEMIKVKDKKIIDIEKLHKNKNNILLDLNESKLQSPVILIDPTYKNRNALAALSNETFQEFQKTAREFLKKPSEKFFYQKEIDFRKIKNNAIKNKNEFILIETETNKQTGDIAGSKLLKFYNLLKQEIKTNFDIREDGFFYYEGKTARGFFVAKRKKEILMWGPFKSDEKNSEKFRKIHSNVFVKKNRLYALKKIDLSIIDFIKNWKHKNKEIIKDMSITKLDLLDKN